MTVSTIKMTARQYLQLGEDPLGVRLELVDGEVAVSPSPTPKHSRIVFALARILGVHIDGHNLGELLGDVDTIFGEHDVRRPDVLFFAKVRLHLLKPNKAIDGPPDLCIEVLSPSSITTDRKDKFAQCATAGVAHYWIVNPDQRTIEAFRLVGNEYQEAARGQGGEVVHLPPFEDLAIPLGKLWWAE